MRAQWQPQERRQWRQKQRQRRVAQCCDRQSQVRSSPPAPCVRAVVHAKLAVKQANKRAFFDFKRAVAVFSLAALVMMRV